MENTNMVSDDKETAESITRVHMTPRTVHGNRGGGLKDSRGWIETLDYMEVHVLAMSCSSPRWDSLPSGHQRYPLKGLNLGYIYWGQKHSSE